MLMPKRVKRRKQHRGRMRGLATRGNTVSFGTYALVAMEPAWITNRQIESARIAMTRHIKRGGKVWIRIFPDKPITKKPLEQRMGKGKAPVEGWVCVVKPGRVMFEMAGPAVDVAREAMRLAMHKMPIRCKFVVREGASQLADPAMVKGTKVEGEVVSEEILEPTAAPETPEAEASAETPATEEAPN